MLERRPMDLLQKQQQFQQEYHELFRYVYQYLGLRIQNVPDKEDLTSNIIMEAYEHLVDFNEVKGSLRQWITGIMKHRLIDFWRKRKVVVNLDEAEKIISQIDGRDVARNVSTIIDERLLVEKIMQQLPETTRTLFYMHYVDDLTYEQIADIINKSASAIRKLFSRAQQQLRQQFVSNH